jgi:hypothetical protein
MEDSTFAEGVWKTKVCLWFMQQDRVDLTHLKVYTIDSDDAEEVKHSFFFLLCVFILASLEWEGP